MMQNNSFGKNIIRGLRERVNKWTYNPYNEVNLSAIKLVYYKHLNPGTIRSHQMFGKTVYFSSATEFVAGLKEIFIDKIYSQRLPDHPYIIDCGANIGLSVIFMKKQYPNAEIVAFEPDEQNFKILKKNVEEGGYSNIELRKEAVWIENTTIHFTSNGTTDSRISPEGLGSVQVVAIRLRDLLIRKIDFLKIDIEGAEFQVIKDIAERLEMVDNMFIEYHGSFEENNEFLAILKIISDNGFRFYFREATPVFKQPFLQPLIKPLFDIQLNIFCFRKKNNMNDSILKTV
jgi:FkbM family methyltransferase